MTSGSGEGDGVLIGNVALDAWIAQALGATSARVTSAGKLSGGAIQENWLLACETTEGRRELVLRRDAPATIAHSRSRAEEFALIEAAFAAGVTVPRAHGCCADASVLGAPFALYEKVAGIGYGPKIVRSMTPDQGDALGRDLGRQLARIHAIPVDGRLSEILGAKPENAALVEIDGLRGALDAIGADRPGLEWGLRWAERMAPSPGEIAFAHRDFRTGNFMVEDGRLTAVLDWEFAGWCDPVADVAWFCAECWRFSRPDLEAGGVASRATFYDGYQAESGREIDSARIRFWEVMAHLRWAVIALEQGWRHASGAEPSLHLALTGRIGDEMELAALRMIAGRDGDDRAPAADPAPSGSGERLLETTAALLRGALASSLTGADRYHALLAANAVAMAAREAALGSRIDAARAATAGLRDAIRAGERDSDDALFAGLYDLAALRAHVARPGALTASEARRHLGAEQEDGR